MRTKAEIAAVLLILWACIAVQVSRGAELTPAQRAKVLLLLEQEQAAQAAATIVPSATMPPRGPVTAPQHARGAAQAQRIRPPAAGIAQPRDSYPTDNRHWTFPGATRSQLINHLLTHAEHRGDFNRQYLESLSFDQLRTLHDHDHEGQVRWSYVRGAPASLAPALPGATRRPAAPSGANCPNGRCPNTTTTRAGWFGWRRR